MFALIKLIIRNIPWFVLDSQMYENSQNSFLVRQTQFEVHFSDSQNHRVLRFADHNNMLSLPLHGKSHRENSVCLFWLWSHRFEFEIGRKAITWPTFHEIMGCNFRNARNGRSMAKTSKWPSLKPLALYLKNEMLWQFEDLHGKSCWRARRCSLATYSIDVL